MYPWNQRLKLCYSLFIRRLIHAIVCSDGKPANGSLTIHPEFADVDARRYLVEKHYQLGEDNYRWEIDNELLPFENDYPVHLLAP